MPLIQSALLESQRAQVKLLRIVAQVQQACAHSDIGQCDYESLFSGASLPPARMCLSCGLSEEGWGCGYLALRCDHPRLISREDLQRSRTGLHLKEDAKIRLIRGEATLAQLIEERLNSQLGRFPSEARD